MFVVVRGSVSVSPDKEVLPASGGGTAQAGGRMDKPPPPLALKAPLELVKNLEE